MPLTEGILFQELPKKVADILQIGALSYQVGWNHVTMWQLHMLSYFCVLLSAGITRETRLRHKMTSELGCVLLLWVYL